MTESVIKVSQSSSGEAYDEIATSNIRHLDEIITQIQSVLTYLSDVPGASTITSALNRFPSLLEDEKQRYTTFANEFKAFYELVPSVDSFVVSQINEIFDLNYVSKTDAELKLFIDNYISGGISLEYQRLQEELGISADEIADLIYITNLINSLEGLTRDEALGVIEAEIGITAEATLASKLLKSLQESLFDNPITVIDNANTIFDASVKAATRLFVEQAYGKTITAAQMASTMVSIDSLTNKLATVNAKIAGNPYILPGGRTFARRDAILKNLAENETFYNSLSTSQKAKIDTAVKSIGRGIEYSLYVVQIGVEGFKSRVIDGKTWEDTFEDIFAAAPGIITAGKAGSAVAAGVTKALAAAGKGSVAGPVGTAVGFVVGVGVAVVYDVFVKPVLKDVASAIGDWWDQLWW